MSRAQLLVSVRNAAEAELALQGGARIIDIKEPSRGPLGRADVATIQMIFKTVGDRASLSVAMGELLELEQLESPEQLTALQDVLSQTASPAYVKIGLAGLGNTDAADANNWCARLDAMFRRFPNAKAVPVAYWDAHRVNAPLAIDVFDWAIEHRAAAVLIDTADKTQPGLLAAPEDRVRLAELLAKAHAHHLPAALAGKLMGQTFAAAAALTRDDHGPAILGVRSAACHQHQREGTICPDAVRKLMAIL